MARRARVQKVSIGTLQAGPRTPRTTLSDLPGRWLIDLLVCVVLHVHPRDDGTRGFLRFECFALSPDLFKFTRIEPEPSAAWAFVQDHSATFAVVMAHERHIAAPGTGASPLEIDPDQRITGNADFDISGDGLGGFDLLKFESVKPNAAATTVTDIENNTRRNKLSELVATCWTDHTVDSNPRFNSYKRGNA